jgi:hypothetical protein
MWRSLSERGAWNKPLRKTSHKFKAGDLVRDVLTDRLGTVNEIKTYSELPDKLLVNLDLGYTDLAATEFYTKVKSNVCRSKTN